MPRVGGSEPGRRGTLPSKLGMYVGMGRPVSPSYKTFPLRRTVFRRDGPNRCFDNPISTSRAPRSGLFNRLIDTPQSVPTTPSAGCWGLAIRRRPVVSGGAPSCADRVRPCEVEAFEVGQDFKPCQMPDGDEKKSFTSYYARHPTSCS